MGFLSDGAPKQGPHLRFGAGRAWKARRENLWVSLSHRSEGTGAEGATNSPFLGFDVRAPGAASSLLKFGKGKRSEVRRGTSQSSTFHFWKPHGEQPEPSASPKTHPWPSQGTTTLGNAGQNGTTSGKFGACWLCDPKISWQQRPGGVLKKKTKLKTSF